MSHPLPRDNRLEEARFWTRIFKEHALFIKLGLPCDRTDLIVEAEAFIERFSALEIRAREAGSFTPALQAELAPAVNDLICFKLTILRMSVQCELRSSLMPLLIDHLTREAIRFVEIITTPRPDDFLDFALQKQVFWLRIMKEHIEFIRHLLDPSERSLIAQTERFRAIFSRLLETARDLKSMSRSDPQFFNTAERFSSEVLRRTQELRDFKQAAHELVVRCRVLSVVSSPLLVDHVRREADKFLDEMEEVLGGFHQA